MTWRRQQCIPMTGINRNLIQTRSGSEPTPSTGPEGEVKFRLNLSVANMSTQWTYFFNMSKIAFYLDTLTERVLTMSVSSKMGRIGCCSGSKPAKLEADIKASLQTLTNGLKTIFRRFNRFLQRDCFKVPLSEGVPKVFIGP
jgi:hypothetical protein